MCSIKSAKNLSLFLLLVCFLSFNTSFAFADDLDAIIFKKINSNGSNPFLDSLMILVSDGSIPFELGSTAALWFWKPVQDRETAVLSGAAMTTTLAASLGIKQIVASPRPSNRLDNVTVLGIRESSYSFPSGHTALAFSFATILSDKYKQWTFPLYGFATAVGFSRIYNGQHFPSDVLGGAITGYFCAKTVLANEDYFLTLAGLKTKKLNSFYLLQPLVSKEYKLIKVTCIF